MIFEIWSQFHNSKKRQLTETYEERIEVFNFFFNFAFHSVLINSFYFVLVASWIICSISVIIFQDFSFLFIHKSLFQLCTHRGKWFVISILFPWTQKKILLSTHPSWKVRISVSIQVNIFDLNSFYWISLVLSNFYCVRIRFRGWNLVAFLLSSVSAQSIIDFMTDRRY